MSEELKGRMVYIESESRCYSGVWVDPTEVVGLTQHNGLSSGDDCIVILMRSGEKIHAHASRNTVEFRLGLARELYKR